jgi:hypothetical protein
MVQDVVVEPVQSRARFRAGQQRAAPVHRVEGTRGVPCLADAVGVEEDPVSRAERDGVLFPVGRVEVAKTERKAGFQRLCQLRASAAEQQRCRMPAVQQPDFGPFRCYLGQDRGHEPAVR